MSVRPQLFIATHNPGKVEEFKALLGEKLTIASAFDPAFRDIPFAEVDETGDTYEANSLLKARAYQNIYRLPVLSDDSGFEVVPLGNRPGLHSARYGGKISFPERFERLYAELTEVSPENWQARFRCVLCYLPIGKEPRYFHGTVEGKLVRPARGNGGFGYDPVFESTDLGKTFGEVSEVEKDRVSHRAAAVKKFLEVWTFDEALS